MWFAGFLLFRMGTYLHSQMNFKRYNAIPVFQKP